MQLPEFFGRRPEVILSSRQTEIREAERFNLARKFNSPPTLDHKMLRRLLKLHVGPLATPQDVISSLIMYYFDVLDLVFQTVNAAQLSGEDRAIVTPETDRKGITSILYTIKTIRIAEPQQLDQILKVIIPSLSVLFTKYRLYVPQSEHVDDYEKYLKELQKFVSENQNNMTSTAGFAQWQRQVTEFSVLPAHEYKSLIRRLNSPQISN